MQVHCWIRKGPSSLDLAFKAILFGTQFMAELYQRIIIRGNQPANPVNVMIALAYPAIGLEYEIIIRQNVIEEANL